MATIVEFALNHGNDGDWYVSSVVDGSGTTSLGICFGDADGPTKADVIDAIKTALEGIGGVTAVHVYHNETTSTEV